MKYFTKIDAFFSRTMTAVEREAFEHEVADNVELAREVNAYQASADLFDFAAGNLSGEEIIGLKEPAAIPAKEGWGRGTFFYAAGMIFLAAALALMLLVFRGDAITNDQEEATPERIEEQKEQPVKQIPVAENELLDVPSPLEQQYLSAVVETKESTNVKEPSESVTVAGKSSPANRTRISEKGAERETATTKTNSLNPSSEELISNALIVTGEEIVYQAGQQITLTPGFHAKAGSSFKAVVVRD